MVEHGGDIAGRGPNLVDIDARFYAHLVQKVEHVLGADVAGRAGRVWAAAQSTRRRIEHVRAHSQCRINIRKRGSARVVKMEAEAIEGNLVNEQRYELFDLRWNADA